MADELDRLTEQMGMNILRKDNAEVQKDFASLRMSSKSFRVRRMKEIEQQERATKIEQDRADLRKDNGTGNPGWEREIAVDPAVVALTEELSRVREQWDLERKVLSQRLDVLTHAMLTLSDDTSTQRSSTAQVAEGEGFDIRTAPLYSYDGPFYVAARDDGYGNDELYVGQGYIWAGTDGFYNFASQSFALESLPTTHGWNGIFMQFAHTLVGDMLIEYNGPYEHSPHEYAGFGTGVSGCPFDIPELIVLGAADIDETIQREFTRRLLAVFYWDATTNKVTHIQQRQYGDIYLYVHAIWDDGADGGGSGGYDDFGPFTSADPDRRWKYSLSMVHHRPNVDATASFTAGSTPTADTGSSEDPDQLDHT